MRAKVGKPPKFYINCTPLSPDRHYPRFIGKEGKSKTKDKENYKGALRYYFYSIYKFKKKLYVNCSLNIIYFFMKLWEVVLS